MFAITKRLLLRPGWVEDAHALVRAIGSEAVIRNLGRLPWPYTLEAAQRFLARAYDPLRPTFLMTRRSDGMLVGGIGIHGDEDPELGYWIARRHWGRGFATEAGRAVIALADASLRLPRLGAFHALDNPASGRVLRKLGFRQLGGTDWAHSIVRDAEMEIRLFERDRLGARPPLAA